MLKVAMRIHSVAIRRFKRLEEVTIPLQDSTVFVGANNSGKSSVLQAIHFAVAVAQTSGLVGGVNWAGDKYQLSFSPALLLYSPVADVMCLASGGNLTELVNKRIEVTLSADSGATCTVALRRGRNRNIQVSIEGRALGERLQDLSRPFSVYAPGLAGVPREEHYISPGLLRRAIARGDANLVLRNVLYQLSKKNDAWEEFHEDLRALFPGIRVQVALNEETDEHISALVQFGDEESLPLDAAGTAVLQASQILSYVALFRPELLILDEPDSHLHPNNQRALCSLIIELSQSRGFQALMSTHSRHVLDAMRGRGSLVWLNKGSVVEDAESETTKMLLDIGALDSIDYFATSAGCCVVATEDEDRDAVRQVLWSSGFREDETEVLSYSGASKADAAIVLGRFLRDKAPRVKLVVHRDRDYMSDDEVARFVEQLRAHDIVAFVTSSSDIEGYYLSVDHVSRQHPVISRSRIVELIALAQSETRERSIAAIVNLRTELAFRRRRGGESVNHGEIAIQATREYDVDPARMARGKIVLGHLKSLLHRELGTNSALIATSPHIADESLRLIANGIWRTEGVPLG
jgi:predicted ATPase